jgi:nicotinamidase/pyrazinamidase
MGRKILIIVDGQYDFLEGGALAVEGGRDAMTNLTEFIEKHYKEYDGIFLTADWHPITHCSFKDNGGIWPTHCVQFSHGAAIYQPILDVLDDLKVDYDVLTKGCDEDHEEYSIFKNVTSEAYLKGMNKYNEIGVVDICGIAGDYCVLETLKNLIDIPELKGQFMVFEDGVASIDGGENLKNFMSENNIAAYV